MKIDILIDKLTPCLEEVATGKILQTTFSIATPAEIKSTRSKGWLFDWEGKELKGINTNIYKLQLKDDDVIQGLVATEIHTGTLLVHLMEAAPHNKSPEKKYNGVGGHLFAIAIKLSLVNGFGGHIYFEAKNQDLVDHYSKTFGALHLRTRLHAYRMEIEGDAAQKIIDSYTLEGDLNVR
jgi:hypothetical protein